MHVNTVISRKEKITLPVNFFLPAYNQGVIYIVDMDGPQRPQVGECLIGCLLAPKQIKMCHTNVSMSEGSHAESRDSYSTNTQNMS